MRRFIHGQAKNHAVQYASILRKTSHPLPSTLLRFSILVIILLSMRSSISLPIHTCIHLFMNPYILRNPLTLHFPNNLISWTLSLPHNIMTGAVYVTFDGLATVPTWTNYSITASPSVDLFCVAHGGPSSSHAVTAGSNGGMYKTVNGGDECY
jgi:hypothetical protein